MFKNLKSSEFYSFSKKKKRDLNGYVSRPCNHGHVLAPIGSWLRLLGRKAQFKTPLPVKTSLTANHASASLIGRLEAARASLCAFI